MLGALVFAGALGGAALTRSAVPTTPTSPPAPTTTTGVGADGCLREPCQVIGTETLGDTLVELVADAGATSGRLRIGGQGGVSQVVEITDIGTLLPSGALQCYPASISACLVRASGEQGLTGRVVVGRSDKWSPLELAYLSTAGYLRLENVGLDSGPEVIAAQYDCPSGEGCPVYAQVFTLGGEELGCTRDYAGVESLPAYPAVSVGPAALGPCD
ncbi:hypothetical protein ACTG9Q_21700 [Actinokineospora sp. 24-640]